MKYIIVVSFIRTAFVVVKLIVFRTDSASMKWPFWWGFFGTLLCQIWSDFVKIFSRDSIQAEKKYFLRIFEKSNFYRKVTYWKDILSKHVEIETLSPLPFQEKYHYFLLYFEYYLREKRRRHMFKSRYQNLTYPIAFSQFQGIFQ